MANPIYSIVLHRSDIPDFDRYNEAFNLPSCPPGVPWVLCRRICGRFFPDVLNVPYHGRVIVEIFDEPILGGVELKQANGYGYLFVNGGGRTVFYNVNRILDPLFVDRDRLFGIVRPFSGD
jgi:hypothetical protein